MNLAPTASTTAALALGDALALALSDRKGFGEEQFADLHPGGRLGRRLMRVESLMQSDEKVPRVLADTPMPDVIHEITSKRLGMTCVTDRAGKLLGVVTDGDLRRHMTPGSNLLAGRAADVMTARPIAVRPEVLAAEALRMMEERKITSLVVVNGRGIVAGVVHLHDLWQTQMV
jgi:arabinose-5-phosphate isomerase